ncbi:MAG: DEAD/DEAH box helicase, partial [Gemmatimonadota bacterium]
MKFEELNLKPELLRALQEMGYEETTPIQEEAIAPILEGRDVMGLAETGSGKTSACGIPMIHNTDPEHNAIQALILVPTRELALQYVTELEKLATYTGVVAYAVYGGLDIGLQKAKLRHKVHILVATPGRLIDLIWNTRIDLTQIRTVVLDEADEMLDMGFIDDVDFILDCLLQEHQTLLFSATMPPEIEKLVDKYQTDPVRVELIRERRAPTSLQHHFLHVARDRTEALIEALRGDGVEQVIIFCNSRDKGSDLYRELRRRVSSVDYIHGGLDQDRRTTIFNKFREKEIKYMVATDVAGRGLDFSHVSHVINFDFPFNPDIYTHRTGRAGRMGRTGTALTLVVDRDLRNLKTLLRVIEVEPTGRGEAPDLSRIPSTAGRRRPRGPGGPAGRRSEHHGPP